MPAFISKEDQVIDKDFFGRKIKYSLWEPESNLKPALFRKSVIQAHEKVKMGLMPEARQNLTGPKFKPLVQRFMELGKEQQQAVIIKGFTQPMDSEQVESVGMSALLRRYREEDTDRRKHKTCYLNDTCIDRWQVFLAEHYPRLTYASFNKKVVEQYVLWRKDYRSLKDRRKGVVHAETINKEIGEMRRCVMWARTEGIVKTDSNAFHNVKVKKDISNTKAIQPLTMEEQKQMLTWLRACGNEWAHDAFLLLLLTGIRVSDWEPLEFNDFDMDEDVIRIHKVAIGGLKTGGKTAAAARVFPMTPTIHQLVQRGFLFERVPGTERGERLSNVFNWKRKHEPIPVRCWPHRLRHTYATNNICAYPDQMAFTSVKLGHRSIGVTIDTYTHFQKIYNHDTMRNRFREFLRWLEHDYFQSVGVVVSVWREELPSMRLASVEVAILEVMELIPNHFEFTAADELMQSLSTLSPRRCQLALQHCSSVKAKRLFFWFSDRQSHAWKSELDSNRVGLGAGKRVIQKNGKLNKTHQITVPREMESANAI